MKKTTKFLQRSSALLGSFLICVVGPIKAGPHWDYQTDDFFSGLNLSFLKDPMSFKENPLYDLFHSYSYTLGYLERLPFFILRYFNLTESFNTAYWIAYRNIFVSVIFLAGIIGLNLWSNYILRINPWISTIIALSFPTLMGHGWMNEKDIPIFSGVCSALALISLVTTNEEISRKRLKIQTWSFFTVLFTLGVRPASFFIVFPLILAIVAYAYVTKKNLLSSILNPWLVAIFMIYLSNTTFRIDGWSWLINSLTQSSNFPWYGAMFSWNKTFISPPPGEYLILVLGSQVPIWTILLILLTIILGISTSKEKMFALIKKRKHPRIRIDVKANSKYFWIIFINLYLCLWLIIAYGLSFNLYDDARQLLFLWALFIAAILSCLSYLKDNIAKYRKLVTLFFSLLIMMVYVDQIKLFPYLYVYRNEVANIMQPNGFETDYWGLSAREASEWLIANEPNPSKKYFAQPLDSYRPYLTLQPMENPTDIDYYLGVWNPVRVVDPRPDCRTVHLITRKQVFGDVKILSEIKECR